MAGPLIGVHLLIALFTLLATAALIGVKGIWIGVGMTTALDILLLHPSHPRTLETEKFYRFSKTDKMLLALEAGEILQKAALKKK
eukprot:scaffold109087_cov19-Tisochrysis_lutea.AAC.1